MPADTRSASVLLVEDDPDYCHLLREAFHDAGFQTIVASNGEQALELLRTQPVDLVVSDFIMPELNGLELCRHLAEDERLTKPKVILYSCNTDTTFRRKARELGAIDYLSKTDDTDSMVEQICALAGITGDGRAASPARPTELDERLQKVSRDATQLKTLFDSLLDFARILALAEDPPKPAAKLAWEAMQRTAGDIRHLLSQLESNSAALAPQEGATEAAVR